MAPSIIPNGQESPETVFVLTPDASSDDENYPASTAATQGSAQDPSEPRGNWLSDSVPVNKFTEPVSKLMSPADLAAWEHLRIYRLTKVGPWSFPLIAVIGVGYVGEHLVNVFSQSFDVLAFDISPARAEFLNEKYKDNDHVQVTCKKMELIRATHFLISVPTLVRPDNTVDASYLESALALVEEWGREGSTVVIESSVAVGMTRNLLGPIAKANKFYAGMSPERVDPGRSDPPAQDIPKVISGLDDVAPGSLSEIRSIYRVVFNHVVAVSKPEVAEMMKLYENCQRMVCIAYANEMADACIAHGIDPFEVCNAAATKPFGYMPMTPSLGVGGHCIPVNPYYLLSNSEFPLLKAATEKMKARPALIAERAIKLLCDEPQHQEMNGDTNPADADGEAQADKDKTPKTPRVLIVGMGFKAGQSHLVNSPGLELAKSLVSSLKVHVFWADPLVQQSAIPTVPRLDEADWTAEHLREKFDMIIVAFRQHGLDFSVLNDLEGVHIEMWCK